MSKQIQSLKSIELCKDNLYFFDANIWLIQLSPKFNPSPREKKYLSFFQAFSENIHKPKIAVTTLLISEIVNRLLRDVHYKTFLKNKGITEPTSSTFKRVFRPTTEYKIAYQTILDDIKSYHQILVQTNDDFGNSVKLKHIMKPHNDLDFNDTYFYYLAKKKNLIVITDDGDFDVDDVEIFTYNNRLLNQK